MSSPTTLLSRAKDLLPRIAAATGLTQEEGLAITGELSKFQETKFSQDELRYFASEATGKYRSLFGDDLPVELAKAAGTGYDMSKVGSRAKKATSAVESIFSRFEDKFSKVDWTIEGNRNLKCDIKNLIDDICKEKFVYDNSNVSDQSSYQSADVSSIQRPEPTATERSMDNSVGDGQSAQLSSHASSARPSSLGDTSQQQPSSKSAQSASLADTSAVATSAAATATEFNF